MADIMSSLIRIYMFAKYCFGLQGWKDYYLDTLTSYHTCLKIWTILQAHITMPFLYLSKKQLESVCKADRG